jgi:hypothetical protein
MRLVFLVRGWNWDGLASMATEASQRRLEDARLPDSVAVINVVAVPVSGSVSAQVALCYKVLLGHGPNDGVVLLADTVWPRGANLVVLGADHLFAKHRGDVYGLAMMRAIDFAVRRTRAALAYLSASPREEPEQPGHGAFHGSTGTDGSQ